MHAAICSPLAHSVADAFSYLPVPLTPHTATTQVVVPVYRLGTPGMPQEVNAESLAEAASAFWAFFPQQAATGARDPSITGALGGEWVTVRA